MQDPQKTPHCVSTGTIALLALGYEDEPQDMIHISQCERCSALLRDAIEDLNREPSPEELALAESIPVPKRATGPKTVPRWPLAIAAALFVLVSASAYRLLTPTQQTLTAQLSTVYSTHRTMDLRFEGGYAPVRLQRSDSHKSPYAPLALAIAEELEKKPHDPSLLRDKGRLALFEGRYDEAISILESIKNADASVQTDLAAAYFQRGLQHDSREDREKAFASYQAFVRSHPADAVAAFNLAVTAAETRPAQEASALFEKYLAMESSVQWKQEAEQRLARLREGSDRQ